MGKKLTNAAKWKNERWFRLLPPYYKLALDYIEAVCDLDGTWQINVMDLLEDLKIPPPFNFEEFIKSVNQDYDKLTGQSIEKQRIVSINKETIWLTYYMSLQLENTDTCTINPRSYFAWVAFKKLAGKGVLAAALANRFIPLEYPLDTLLIPIGYPSHTPLYIDIDIDRDKRLIKVFEINGLVPKRRGKAEPEDETPAVFQPPKLGTDEIWTGKPPPSPFPEMTKENFIDFPMQLAADELFVMPIMSTRGIKNKADLLLWCEIFNAHIVADKETRKDYEEYRRHFANWIVKRETHAGPPKGDKNGTANGKANSVTVPKVTPQTLKKYEKQS